PVQSIDCSAGRGSFASNCHPVLSSGGDGGAVTPEASVSCPPERTAPFDTSNSPILARSICVSDAVRLSGEPSVGNRTILVPSGFAMNKPSSDHEPLPPDVRYVAPVITLPSIASPDSCSPRTDCPMMRIPSSSPTVALPKSNDSIMPDSAVIEPTANLSVVIAPFSISVPPTACDNSMPTQCVSPG